jgi:hypothetical protein
VGAMAQKVACQYFKESGVHERKYHCRLRGKIVECLGLVGRCSCPQLRDARVAAADAVPRSEAMPVWEG